MSTDTVAFIVAIVLQTGGLVWWGSRLQFRVERHDESLYGERGLHHWRHDVVTPRLTALDDVLEDRKDGKAW